MILSKAPPYKICSILWDGIPRRLSDSTINKRRQRPFHINALFPPLSVLSYNISFRTVPPQQAATPMIIFPLFSPATLKRGAFLYFKKKKGQLLSASRQSGAAGGDFVSANRRNAPVSPHMWTSRPAPFSLVSLDIKFVSCYNIITVLR